jgi:hypothetical protein
VLSDSNELKGFSFNQYDNSIASEKESRNVSDSKSKEVSELDVQDHEGRMCVTAEKMRPEGPESAKLPSSEIKHPSKLHSIESKQAGRGQQ